MEEKKKRNQADQPLPETEKFINNPEADTDDIVDFMHEEIRKRPVNRKRLLRRASETMAVAVIFGIVSCIVFAILLPVINNVLYPSEETQTMTLPEEKPSEELTPEEMLEIERTKEVSQEREILSKELDALLDEKIVGVEQYKRISAAMQELAADHAGMIVSVSGITSDTDLFNDSYENRDTASGLVTKKSSDAVYVLVQGRRIEDAQRIMVTFYDGTEIEASVTGTDELTGLALLSVPMTRIPLDTRSGIQEASLGTSEKTAITGAPVIALGSPAGTAGTVIYGNVTGADVSLQILDNDLHRLTTDIFGGADATGFLINLDGEVVGMINMDYRDANIPNMLCAAGISELRPVIRRMESGRTKAFLGICGADVTDEISEANHIPVGVWVTRVEDDSPAMAAGIQKGDIITEFEQVQILRMSALTAQLENAEPGQNAELQIRRRKGESFEEIEVDVPLE